MTDHENRRNREEETTTDLLRRARDPLRKLVAWHDQRQIASVYGVSEITTSQPGGACLGDEGRLLADGMHLPVGSVGCGENYGTVGSHEGAGPCGPSLAPLQGVNSRYHQVDDADAGGGGGEMSESAAVGELWWTERLVGEAQAEHPGELVRTGWYQVLLTMSIRNY